MNGKNMSHKIAWLFAFCSLLVACASTPAEDAEKTQAEQGTTEQNIEENQADTDASSEDTSLADASQADANSADTDLEDQTATAQQTRNEDLDGSTPQKELLAQTNSEKEDAEAEPEPQAQAETEPEAEPEPRTEPKISATPVTESKNAQKKTEPKKTKPKAKPKAKAKPKTQAKPKPKPKAKPKAQAKPKPKAKPETQIAQNTKPSSPKETKQEAKQEPKTQAKPKPQAEPKAQAKPKSEAKPKTQAEPKTKAKPKTEAKPKPKAEPKQATATAQKKATRSDSALLAATVAQECSPGEAEQCLADLDAAAEQAIETANAAGAELFSPEEIAAAQKSLQQAQEAEDTQSKRQLYLAAAQKAQEAHQNAINATEEQLLAATEQLGAQLAEYLDQQLDDLEAAKYMPEDDVQARKAVEILRKDADPSLSAEENAEQYQDAATNAKAVINALSNNLAWLDDLEQQVTELQTRVNSQRSNELLAEANQQASSSLDAAREAKEQGQLAETESNLFAARKTLQDVLQDALKAGQSEALLDRSITLLQENLEESSQYSSVAEDGTEYPAPNWTAADFLAENPLVDLPDATDTEDESSAEEEPQSRLQEPLYAGTSREFEFVFSFSEDEDGDEDTLGSSDSSSAPSSSQSTSQAASQIPPQTPPEVYARAVEAWENAVRLRNQQDMLASLDKLDEAKDWLEQYRSLYAVQSYYVVIENIDSLWTIAGYESIYGNPFQWRRIYNRNSEIIDNPRLIYPDQRLLIPPPRLP